MSDNPTVETMQEILHQQRQAQIKGGAVPAALRIDRLQRAVSVLERNADAFCDSSDAPVSRFEFFPRDPYSTDWHGQRGHLG